MFHADQHLIQMTRRGEWTYSHPIIIDLHSLCIGHTASKHCTLIPASAGIKEVPYHRLSQFDDVYLIGKTPIIPPLS